jgi:preprotein translocase subunit SecA
MFEGILKKIFGDKNQNDLNELSPIIESSNLAYKDLINISDDHLREKTNEFKLAIQNSCFELKKKKEELISKLYRQK